MIATAVRIRSTDSGPVREVFDGTCWRYPEPEQPPAFDVIWNGGLLFSAGDWQRGYSSGLGTWPVIVVDGDSHAADWAFIGYGLGDKRRKGRSYARD